MSVPPAVLGHGNGVTVSHHGAPELQRPTLPRPAAWQAPGVPVWRLTPWRALVRRDVRVPPATRTGGVMSVYVPLVVATLRGASPGVAQEVSRPGIAWELCGVTPSSQGVLHRQPADGGPRVHHAGQPGDGGSVVPTPVLGGVGSTHDV